MNAFFIKLLQRSARLLSVIMYVPVSAAAAALENLSRKTE